MPTSLAFISEKREQEIEEKEISMLQMRGKCRSLRDCRLRKTWRRIQFAGIGPSPSFNLSLKEEIFFRGWG